MDRLVRCRDSGRGAEGGGYRKAVERVVVMHRPIRMRDTTYNTMAFAEGDVDNEGRFELFAPDMKLHCSEPDIDTAWGPVLPPDAHDTGPPRYTPTPCRCGTRPARSATAWLGSGSTPPAGNWSAQFGGLGYDGDLDLYTVNGMVGEAFRHLPGAELQSTGWPIPRRASPLPMLSRSGPRSWKPLRRQSPRSRRPSANVRLQAARAEGFPPPALIRA